MDNYTPDALIERIRKVMITRRCTSDDAVRAVVAEIAQRPEELTRWWTVLGPWWVDRTQKELGEMGVLVPKSGQELPAPVAASPQVGRARPSWRENVDPLELVLPVGATGVRKRIGDFTRADMLAMRDFYHAKGRQLTEEGDRWGEFAYRMREDETLESAIGRVSAEERGLLPAKLQKYSENIPAGVEAGG